MYVVNTIIVAGSEEALHDSSGLNQFEKWKHAVSKLFHISEMSILCRSSKIGSAYCKEFPGVVFVKWVSLLTSPDKICK
jgi:hypothetical protein